MAKLSLECKRLMVEEISSRLNKAEVLIVTNYKGLTAQDLNALRKELRSISGEYVVIKDSMARRAFDQGPNTAIPELIRGEVGVAVGRKDDPIHISKALIKFTKGHEALKIHGGIVNGTVISEEDIKALAALPSREVLLANLANVLNAPIQGIASVLNAIICKVVYALNAVKKKAEGKEGQVT